MQLGRDARTYHVADRTKMHIVFEKDFAATLGKGDTLN